MTGISEFRGCKVDPFDLKLFSSVVETGTITGGARRVHLSVAAASLRLKNLEHRIGASLLLRGKKGVSLTDAGRTLLHHAGRIQRELDSMYAELTKHGNGMRSTVRLLCNTAAMTEYLPEDLGRFLAKHPDIDIDLKELGSQDALQALFQEKADIGIVADSVNTEGLTKRIFCLDHLVVLLPKMDEEHWPSNVEFVDLIGRPFVGLPAESGLSRFLQGQALQYGRGLHHRVRVHDMNAVVKLVANNVGIAIVPAAAARRLATSSVLVVRLSDSWATRKLLLCTPREAELGAGARLLFEFLSPSSEEF